VLAADMRFGRRRLHRMPEHETVVGRFGKCGGKAQAAIENARLVHAAKARPPPQRGVAERRGQKIVVPGGAGRVRRLAVVDERFQHGLLFQSVDVAQRGDLFLAFDQPDYGSGYGPHVPLAPALLPDHQVLPRMASVNCSTVISPWMLSICLAGMPPVTRLGVCMKWRIQSGSPPASV